MNLHCSCPLAPCTPPPLRAALGSSTGRMMFSVSGDVEVTGRHCTVSEGVRRRSRIMSRTTSRSPEATVDPSPQDPSGCLCGTESLFPVLCSLVPYPLTTVSTVAPVQVSCPPANCSSPLRPRGHCCWDFCGATIHIQADRWLHCLGNAGEHGPGSIWGQWRQTQPLLRSNRAGVWRLS